MRKITTTLLIAGLLFLSALPLAASCGQEGNSGKNEEKMETGTIHLTKAEFLQKVWNYEANPRPGNMRGQSLPSWISSPHGADPARHSALCSKTWPRSTVTSW